MPAFFETKEFWAAVITSIATVFAVWLAVILGLRKLRDTEIGRLRINCAIKLIAYRFVLSNTGSYNSEDKIPFFAALNAIPGLFGSDDKAMRLLRDFREESSVNKNKVFLLLIREVALIANVPLSSVSDIDLEKPFS